MYKYYFNSWFCVTIQILVSGIIFPANLALSNYYYARNIFCNIKNHIK